MKKTKHSLLKNCFFGNNKASKIKIWRQYTKMSSQSRNADGISTNNIPIRTLYITPIKAGVSEINCKIFLKNLFIQFRLQSNIWLNC